MKRYYPGTMTQPPVGWDVYEDGTVDIHFGPEWNEAAGSIVRASIGNHITPQEAIDRMLLLWKTWRFRTIKGDA